MSIYFQGYNYLDNIFLLDCQKKASVSTKCGYVWREKLYIYSTVMNLAYMLFQWNPWRLSTITGVTKRTAFVSFITLKSIYLKSIHHVPKSKAIISHDWCDVIGLYFTSSSLRLFSTYFEDGEILGSIGINSSQDYIDWFD